MALIGVRRALLRPSSTTTPAPPPVVGTPTLAITSGVADYTPDFSITSGDILTGDTVRLQYSTNPAFPDSNFATALVANGQVIFNFAAPFTDQTWYFQARVERAGYTPSAWSNTASEGIVALPSAMMVGLPWRPVLMPPTSTVRRSELNVGVGLFGSIS